MSVAYFEPGEKPTQFATLGDKQWATNPLFALAEAPVIDGTPVQWFDPREGRTFAAAGSAKGLWLFTESSPGVWGWQNVTKALTGNETSFSSVVTFRSIDGAAHVIGLDASGDLIEYTKPAPTQGPGSAKWTVRNFTEAELEPRGLTTPSFQSGMSAFVTKWGAVNIIGLDAAGSIQSLWTTPKAGRWFISDLSKIAKTPALVGSLTTFITPWNSINIVGVDATGQLHTTWWKPNGGKWTASNLTAKFSGPALQPSSLTSFATSWGGLNIAGLDNDGHLRLYWWSPKIKGQWRVADLSESVTGAPALKPMLASATNTANDPMNIVGLTPDGQPVRFAWRSGEKWRVENLEQVSVPRAISPTLPESVGLAREAVIPIDLSAGQGTRGVRFALNAIFDRGDTAGSVEDVFNVYVLDADDPASTVLDKGVNGTPVLSLRGDALELAAGIAKFDGTDVEIDLSSITGTSRILLLLQALNSDSDSGSRFDASAVTIVTDPEGQVITPPAVPTLVEAPGTPVDLATLATSKTLTAEVANVRLDSTSGKYLGDVRVRNSGSTTVRDVAVRFAGLPTGVDVSNKSGEDASGDPYVTMSSALPEGGLGAGGVSGWVLVEIDVPGLTRFALVAEALAKINGAPVADPIGTLSVSPGGYLQVPLTATDPNGDRVRFTVKSKSALPASELRDDNTLIFTPAPADLGAYKFDVVATDGDAEVTQSVTLNVVPDAVTTTRVSGIVLDTDGSPLVGVPVRMTVGGSTLESSTDSQGRFTVEAPAGTDGETVLEVRANELTGSKVYPAVPEKLKLLLNREAVYGGYNNVIGRPIYLPALDVANAVTINPAQNTQVSTPTIPGAEVSVAAGTLKNQQGQLFTGGMSITEVPRLLTPAALPPNLVPDMVVTIQPGEMVFTQPAPLTLPNLGGYEPGTTMDLWSINPATGLFDNVGQGKVSSDGKTIQTIQGGIINSSWHFFAPPPPSPGNPDDDGNNENGDCDSCKATAEGTSEIKLHSGALVESHALVPYQSQGASRGLTLRYESLRADPRPIVHFNYSNVPANFQRLFVANMVVERGAFKYEVPGANGTPYGINAALHFWNLPSAGGSAKAALQANLSNQPTGIYSYKLMTGLLQLSQTGGAQTLVGSMASSGSTFVIVNDSESVFGAGWNLAGVQRLVENPGGSILLVDGDGTQLQFKPASGGEYTSSSGDFSKLVKQANGTFKRSFKDGSFSQFDAANRLVSMTDANGNTTQHNYGPNGRLLSIVDPVGLTTTFGYGPGGRVTSITDPAGRVTKMQYDVAGNLQRVTDPDGTFRTFSYNASHLMTGEVDKRGLSETAEYDFAGRVTKAIRKDGTVVSVVPPQVQGLSKASLTTNINKPGAAVVNGPVDSDYIDGSGYVRTTVLDKRGQEAAGRDAISALPAVQRDAQNLIKKWTDSRGFATDRTFDSLGNMLTSDDPVGLSTYEYDAKFSRVTKMTDPLGRVTEYQIDSANGNLLSIKAPDGTTVSYTYNSDGQVLTSTDARGTITEYAYNAAGRVIKTTFAKGKAAEATRQYEYDSAGNQTAMIDENGNRTEFTYDAVGRLLSTKDALGNVSTYQYDADGNLIKSVDARGNATLKQYDSRSRLTQTTAADGSVTKYTYDNNGNLASVTDPVGQTTKYTYDARNRLIKTVDARGGVTTYRYDASDNLVGVTDPVGNITNFSYDSRNRLVSEVQVTDDPGTAIQVDLSKFKVISHAGGFPSPWTIVNNGLSVRTDVNAGTPSFFISDQDLIDSQVTIKGRVDDTSDDDFIGFAFGLTVDPTNNAPDNYYVLHWKKGDQSPGEEGVKLLKVTDAGQLSDNVMSNQLWDGENTANMQVLSTILGQDKGWEAKVNYAFTLAYSSSGTFKIEIRNDDTGDLVHKINFTDTDPLGTGRFAFYSQSQANTVYTPNFVSVPAKSYIYDEADNLVTMIDRLGRRTDYTYDTRNRLTLESWLGAGHDIEYTYDDNGNLLTATDPSSKLTMSYDARDRLKTVNNTGTPNVPPVVLTYNYDAAGNVISVLDSINGQSSGVTKYVYDALNRVTRATQNGSAPSAGVQDKRVDFAYNQLGQYAAINRYNSLAATNLVANSTFAYDNLNRVTTINHANPGGQPIAFFNYAYDAASRITGITDLDGSITYAYDQTNQLTATQYSDPGRTDESYDYDLNGNRLTSHRSASHTTGQHNRLLSDDTYTYEYDREGNLTKRTAKADSSSREFAWDHRNRLTLLTDKDSSGGGGVITQTVAFAYDSSGRRIQKIETNYTAGVAGTPIATSFVYDREDIALRFRDADGVGTGAAPALEQRILHGPGIDMPLMLESITSGGKQTLTLLADHLGSIRAEVDHATGTVTRQNYDAFGAPILPAGTSPEVESLLVTDYAFTARELDRETGLMYYRGRFFSPNDGVFVSVDRIGIGINYTNRYNYVGANPLNWVDPSGYTACPPTLNDMDNARRRFQDRGPMCVPSDAGRPDWDMTDWIPYKGDPNCFHCGYAGFVENIKPSVSNPQGECFYDKQGNLVDSTHKYKNCAGTPNDYDATQKWDHTFNDRGGIWEKGWDAYNESRRYFKDQGIKDPGCY